LAIVWRLVADRLAHPMDLVGIPGHVLVRVPSGPRRILVDPCAKGRPVSRREVREYLEAYDIPFGPGVFETMDDRAIMRRLVTNWMKSLGMRGQFGRAEELLTLHALLDE
jgi:regulator of sirC expression with transglutaminase-like and TPR domain